MDLFWQGKHDQRLHVYGIERIAKFLYYPSSTFTCHTFPIPVNAHLRAENTEILALSNSAFGVGAFNINILKMQLFLI